MLKNVCTSFMDGPLFNFSDEKGDPKSEKVIEALETIDDDCDRQGIILVKLDNPEEAKQYGIDELPSLVYFEDTIPHLYESNLENENEVYRENGPEVIIFKLLEIT